MANKEELPKDVLQKELQMFSFLADPKKITYMRFDVELEGDDGRARSYELTYDSRWPDYYPRKPVTLLFLKSLRGIFAKLREQLLKGE